MADTRDVAADAAKKGGLPAAKGGGISPLAWLIVILILARGK